MCLMQVWQAIDRARTEIQEIHQYLTLQNNKFLRHIFVSTSVPSILAWFGSYGNRRSGPFRVISVSESHRIISGVEISAKNVLGNLYGPALTQTSKRLKGGSQMKTLVSHRCGHRFGCPEKSSSIMINGNRIQRFSGDGLGLRNIFLQALKSKGATRNYVSVDFKSAVSGVYHGEKLATTMTRR